VVVAADQDQLPLPGHFAQLADDLPVPRLELFQIQIVDCVTVQDELIEVRLKQLREAIRLTVARSEMDVADDKRAHKSLALEASKKERVASCAGKCKRRIWRWREDRWSEVRSLTSEDRATGSWGQQFVAAGFSLRLDRPVSVKPPPQGF